MGFGKEEDDVEFTYDRLWSGGAAGGTGDRRVVGTFTSMGQKVSKKIGGTKGGSVR